MPIIELARRIWENGGYGHTGGSADSDTAEGAELLGGLCWQMLSQKWLVMYGLPFDPAQHTSNTFSDMHEVFGHGQMARAFAEGGGVSATEAEIRETLAWKEKAAFMTRTTTIGADRKR